ncbi:beta strand repeat-containing protein, partial [Aquirufa sp. ROCK-SH2]
TTSTVTVTLKDANSNPVSGKTVVLTDDSTTSTISAASGSSNASGVVTFTVTNTIAETVIYSATGDNVSITDTARVAFVPGTATQIAINDGNNQSATVNTNVTTAPSVIVKDANNNVVSGVSVTFAVATGAGSITGGTAITGADGIATLGSWKLGTTAGSNTLTATSTGLTGSPLTFTATGTADVPNKIAIVSLNPADPIRGIPRTEINVQLQDTYGNATVANVDVPFTLSSNKTFEQYQDNTYTSTVTTPGGTIPSGQSSKLVQFIRFTQSTRVEASGVSYPATANVTATDSRPTPLLTSVQSANFIITDGTLWLPYFRAGSFSANLIPTNSNIGNWTEIDWETSKDGGNHWETLRAGASIPVEFSNEEIVQVPTGANLNLNTDIILYNMEVNGQLEIPSTRTLTLKHTAFDVTSPGIKVVGTFKNSGGTFTDEDNSNAILFDGGTYLHTRNGGSIPKATWQTLGSTSSTARITGITSTALTAGLNQSFQNFEWNNSAQTITQTLTGDVSVSGLFDLANGKLNIGSHQLSLGGTIQHGASAYLHGTATSSLVVTGTGQTQFESPNQIVQSLSLNNASGLILNSDLLVKDNLTLTAGVLKLATNTLELHYKGANQIQRTDGYVNGKLRRIYPADAVNPVFDYPIGSDEGYAPVTLNFSQANISANTEILGYTQLGVINTRQNGSGFKSDKQMQRYWELTPNVSLGTFEYNVSMDNLPNAELTGLTFNNLVVRKLSENGNGSSKSWKKPNSTTRTVISSNHKLTATGFKDFSEFYVGEPLIKTFQLRGPSDVIAGQTSGTITLTVIDELGDPVPVSEETVFTLSSDVPATATLPATLTLAAGQSSGTFTYSNTVSGAQVITATWTSGVAALTGIVKTHDITVLPENANKLAYVVHPQTAAVGETLGSIQVQVLDQFNNLVSGSTAPITLAIDTNPGSGTLAGTLTANAVAGVATFTGLSINKIGTGYTLNATSPTILSKISNTFDVTKKLLTAADPVVQKVKEYDGNRTASVTPGTLSGVLSGQTVNLNATATYDTKDVASNKTITVVYTLSGADAGNYTAPADFVVTDGQITAKALTVTADNQTVNYGSSVASVTSAGTYQVTGFIDGENASVISVSVTYSTTYTNTTGAATSGVTITPDVSGLTATNYSFTPANGTITINKSSSTVTVTGSTSFTYSGSAQGPSTSTTTGSSGAVTYSYEGTGSTTYSASSTAPTNAGTYKVVATLAADSNYEGATSA